MRSFLSNFYSRTERSIRIGIIGLGKISNVHFLSFQHDPRVKIIAISDINADLLKEKKRLYQVPHVYSNPDELFSDQDLDVIDILTPNNLHVAYTLKALRSGKHVICEKPLAIHNSEITTISRLCKKMNRYVFVKHYFRYVHAHQEFQKKLKYEIGKPYFLQILFTVNAISDFTNPFSWRNNLKETGGGVLMDNGIHILDLLQWFFGIPEAVYSQSDKIRTTLTQKGEDFFQAIIAFPNQISASISLNAADSSLGFRWFENYFGKKGSFHVECNGKQSMKYTLYRSGIKIFEKQERNWWEKANVSAISDIIDRIYYGDKPSISLDSVNSVINTIQSIYANNNRYFRLKK